LAAGCPTREAYAEARREEAVEALEMAGMPADAITHLQFTDQEVAFHLNELTRQVQALIERSKPEIVLTHAYEGGHPDHDSVAFACHMAHRMCRPETGFALCEFTGYHRRTGGIEISRFLYGDEDDQFTYALSPEEQDVKTRMIETFITQSKTLQPFLPPEVETFRIAPQYDFTRPPHAGKLWYENFNWGVDGATWREMASQTLTEFFHP
jgi:LmbE family N-acetylglucosaminyl deacetylase